MLSVSDFSGRRITDILLVGFVDIEDGTAQFYPDYRWIYLELDGSELIEFSAGSDGRLSVQTVNEARFLFAVDEDMHKAKMSAIETVLVSSYLAGSEISEAELGNAEEAEGCLRCDFARFILKNGQRLFLDPSFHYGIGIGGEAQEKYWMWCENGRAETT